ncbi:MAG TPA: hypothetical protein VF515_12805 [Candidatus Binatia bacterium]
MEESGLHVRAIDFRGVFLMGVDGGACAPSQGKAAGKPWWFRVIAHGEEGHR